MNKTLTKYFFTNSFGILISRILGFIRNLLFGILYVIGANIHQVIIFQKFREIK